MDAVIRKAVEAKLSSMGIDWLKLQTLELDRATRTLAADIELDGETDPVHVDVRYEVDGDDVVIQGLDTSKAWMSRLAAFGLERQGGRFPLPGGIQGKMIRGLL